MQLRNQDTPPAAIKTRWLLFQLSNAPPSSRPLNLQRLLPRPAPCHRFNKPRHTSLAFCRPAASFPNSERNRGRPAASATAAPHLCGGGAEAVDACAVRVAEEHRHLPRPPPLTPKRVPAPSGAGLPGHSVGLTSAAGGSYPGRPVSRRAIRACSAGRGPETGCIF